MNRIEIRALIQEKNDWCVSVIIPAHRTSPDRRLDGEELHKTISNTKALLIKKNPPSDTLSLLTGLIDKLVLQVDHVHTMDGLGIFVSPDVARLVKFPFPVTAKIVVDRTFETRDLYYLEQFAKPYYLLKLVRNEAHLFLLETGSVAREITNTHFPMRNGNESAYEYARSTVGSSFGYAKKGFEKDKSVVIKTSQESFYKNVQHNLMPYLKTGDLLIAGAKNILSRFESVKDQHLRIKARVIGSLNNQNDLFERAKQTYFDYKHNEIQTLIDGLNELIGKKKVAFEIHNVWSNANAGNGDVLLVEKNFRKVGYTLQNGRQMSLIVSKNKHDTMPDLVDQIIKTILNKGGRVVFTEDMQLEKYEQIALTLRY